MIFSYLVGITEHLFTMPLCNDHSAFTYHLRACIAFELLVARFIKVPQKPHYDGNFDLATVCDTDLLASVP